MARELWTCPSCGRRLAVRNQEHTCGQYDLESHFAGRDPVGRFAFEWMCGLLAGEYDVLPMKTLIAFAAGANFAFLRTKRRGAEVSVVLARPLESQRITGQVPYSKVKTIYRFTVMSKEELDSELGALVIESFEKVRH